MRCDWPLTTCIKLSIESKATWLLALPARGACMEAAVCGLLQLLPCLDGQEVWELWPPVAAQRPLCWCHGSAELPAAAGSLACRAAISHEHLLSFLPQSEHVSVGS